MRLDAFTDRFSERLTNDWFIGHDYDELSLFRLIESYFPDTPRMIAKDGWRPEHRNGYKARQEGGK